MNGNVLEMTPPLTLSDDDIHQAVDILDLAFEQLSSISDDAASQFAGW